MTTPHPLCTPLVFTHLPRTMGDFSGSYRSTTSSHGPLKTTDNPMNHVISRAMLFIIHNYDHPSSTLHPISNLPRTMGDFSGSYRSTTSSHGPLKTTDNPMNHVISRAMLFIIHNYDHPSSTLHPISLYSPS